MFIFYGDMMTKLAKLLSFFTALAVSTQLMAFELKHSEGTIKLDSTPERIVSYDLAIVDSLNFLGVDVVGMPDVHSREAFAKYAEVKAAGTMFDPDYAALGELKPDLIFASRRTAAKQEELTKVAPVAYYEVNNFKFLEDFRANNLNLAKAFDKEAEAKAKIAEIDADLEKLQALNINRTAVFMMVFDNGRIAPQVQGDLFGFTYDAFGLTPVLEARNPDVPRPPRPKPGSPEAQAAAEARAKQVSDIAKAKPDWLVVFDRGQLSGVELTADKMLKEHPELGKIDAVINNQIIYIDPAEWYLIVGGLNNFHNIVIKLITQMQ